MIRGAVRVLAVLFAFVAMFSVAPAAGAAKTISTSDYAATVCLAEGPFVTSLYLANNALNASGGSTDPTTVRNALYTFANDAGAATVKFRTALTNVGTAKSSEVQSSTLKAIAKLKAIEKLLATTKDDTSALNVNDVNAFGIGLVIVQKDLVKVSSAYSAVGKIKQPKVLDRAMKNDPVCQKVLADIAATAAG